MENKDNKILDIEEKPFCLDSNIQELERRIDDYENGKDCFHSHELIEEA